MKNDFDIITRTFPKQNIKILVVSDVHLGSSECMESAWFQFCADVLNEDDVYIILNGDLIDNAVKNGKSDVYGATMSPHKAKELMTECLRPLAAAGRILCITEGNHEQRTYRECGEYLGYDIACRLGIEDLYRPNICFVTLRFQSEKGQKDSGRSRPSYNLCVTHGAGTTLKRFQDYGCAIDNLDIMVVGHTHQPIVAKNKKIYFDAHNNKISFKDYYTVVAGSWLNYGGYAITKMYKPGANGLQVINLKGNEKKISVTQM